MFIGEFKEKTRHVRTSKLGEEHAYYREKTFVKLRCDNCDTDFVHHYGLDPEMLVYTHKVGDIYGKKNLKVPHAKYSTSKRVKNLHKRGK